MTQQTLREGDRVTYQGSVVPARGLQLVAYVCCCDNPLCTDRWELDDPHADETVLRHVRSASITPA